MIKVLFLPAGDRKFASSRYRVYQFLGAISEQGVQTAVIEWHVKQNALYKLSNAAKTMLSARKSDVVFIQKRYDQAAVWANAMGKKVIFDFDDAIWMRSPTDKRNPAKFARLMRNLHIILESADLIITGNRYLQDYALQYNQNVEIVPTVVDLQKYIPLAKRPDSAHITIGWVGNASTVHYLHLLDRVFAHIAERYPGQVQLKVICNELYYHDSLPVQNIPWRLEREVEELWDIDIGIMPLPDNPWERGKCGFKLIQYMALGIVPVGSPIGVNQLIINHQANGFLPDGEEAWINTLSLLIENQPLRAKLGASGRKTIEANYSLQAVQPRFYEIIRNLARA